MSQRLSRQPSLRQPHLRLHETGGGLVELADVPGRAETFVDRTPVDEHPHLVEIVSLVADAGFDRVGDFEFAVDPVRDGLERSLGLATA